MRIGIDASRAFGQERTGTENYSYEIITRILKLPEAKKHEFVLYVRPNFKFQIFNFKLISNFKFQILNYPWLWTQLGLALSTWTDNLDVLWIPAHTLPILRKPGLKTVVTIHGIEYEWLPAYENWLQRWYLPLSTKYACWAADKLIAVSKFTKDQLVQRFGTDSNKIQVVHEGITLDTKRYTNVLDRYGLEKGKYLLFVGTVQPRKNLVRLIEAYNSLRLRHPSLKLREGTGGELKLVIAGKLGWNYQEVVAEASKNKNVIITGFVSDEDRNTLLKNALCYVQPSITEGFGLPVLEAMNAGVPVVSSFGGALKEVVGNAGLLFDPYDLSDLSVKLVQIVSDPKLRKLLIAKGHLRARDFSWEKAARETYRILIGK